MNRRDFLKTAAFGAAAMALNAHVAGAADQKVMKVGLIGTGWYGKLDLCRLIQVSPVEVVSLCDVDSQMLANAADLISTRQKSHKKPNLFGDYREMLKAEKHDIVLIGTPDHWHALPMIAACEAGADVYCQKPISIDIAEGQAMLAAARKHKRVVQIGTQRRSTPHLVEAKKEFCDTGALGKVGMVEIYCYYHMRARETEQEAPDTKPPANLNYEMWSGPAPARPYNKLCHPKRWRAFMEYSNGIVGDMCVHMLDMTRWMLNLGWPKSVSSTGGILVDKASRANITDTQSAEFNFDGLPVIWQHRTWGANPPGMGGDGKKPPYPRHPWGCTIYGDKGTLEASVQGYTFTPAKGEVIHKDVVLEREQFPEDVSEPGMEIHVAPAVRAHMKNLLENIASRGKPVADIEQGYMSTATCILANLSQKLGRALTWDAEKGQIANDPEANKLLKRPYHAPWKHPADAMA